MQIGVVFSPFSSFSAVSGIRREFLLPRHNRGMSIPRLREFLLLLFRQPIHTHLSYLK